MSPLEELTVALDTPTPPPPTVGHPPPRAGRRRLHRGAVGGEVGHAQGERGAGRGCRMRRAAAQKVNAAVLGLGGLGCRSLRTRS